MMCMSTGEVKTSEGSYLIIIGRYAESEWPGEEEYISNQIHSVSQLPPGSFFYAVAIGDGNVKLLDTLCEQLQRDSIAGIVTRISVPQLERKKLQKGEMIVLERSGS